MAVSHQAPFPTLLSLIVVIIFPIAVLCLEPPSCRFVLTEPSGNLTSPEYPEDYPNGALCTWEIRAEEGERIRLRFTEFHLEASLDCANDYLEIYDGENFAAYCGRDIPPDTESKANVMSIVLYTDGLINLGDRFSAEYEIFADGEEPDEGCAYFVDLTDKTTYGFLASPNHPGNYPDNASCRYDILWERDGNLWARFTQVAFLRFKTVRANLGGTGDLVRTYQDSVEDSTLTFGGNYQIPADDAISNLPFVSAPRVSNLSLAFTSDSEGADAGFLMAYASEIAPFSSEETATKMRQHLKKNKNTSQQTKFTTTNASPKVVVHMDFVSKKIFSTNPKYSGLAHFGSPGGDAQSAATLDYGFIMSPNHPLEYDPSDYVLYNITVPAGKKVAICLLRLAMGYLDYLILADAEAESDDSWMYSEVESSIPHVWVSPYSNQVLARFRADGVQEMTGFLAAVAAVDMEPSAA